MFEVVVPDGLEAKLYNLSVSDYKAIKNAIKEKINKIGKLTVEIEKSLKMYGVRDKEIMKENKAYKKLHEEFLKKLEKYYTDISSKNQKLFNYIREKDRELSWRCPLSDIFFCLIIKILLKYNQILLNFIEKY